MEQNKTLMHFLIFGISIILIFFTGCKKEYWVRADWIYINETGHSITYSPEYYNNDFSIKPYDTIIYHEDGDGGNNLTEKDYVSPLHNAYKILFDNIKCDTLKGGSEPYLGDGPTGTINYESRKLEENYYEFTYRFTEEQYTNAKECK
jgi:hypothetical protein